MPRYNSGAPLHAESSPILVHQPANQVAFLVRLGRAPLTVTAPAVRLVAETTWSASEVRVFAFDLR